MKQFAPDLLQDWTQGSWTFLPQNRITNFCFDTRKLKPNECFLAIKNDHNDGHNYVNMAQKCGAVAAIVEHPIADVQLPQLVVKNTLSAFQQIAKKYRESLPTNIIAVTGSCGKTTFKELLALLLGENTFKTPNNFNNQLGLPYSITHIDKNLHPYAVIEVGISQPNEMDLLADILKPDETILTNIAPVHIENFDSLETLTIEKFKLLNCAKYNSFFPEIFKKYNSKTEHFFQFSEAYKETDFSIFYTLQETPIGWNIQVENSIFSVPFLLGSECIKTFAMAIAIAQKHGIPDKIIQERLTQWRPFYNRGIWQQVAQRKYFVDCYNANPLSYSDSLQHFYREKPNYPTCFVLGSMQELGQQSTKYHQQLARNIQGNPDDVFICVGDFCDAISQGLISAHINEQQIYCVKTCSEAKQLLNHLPHLCVYVKGSHCYHLENLVAEV